MTGTPKDRPPSLGFLGIHAGRRPDQAVSQSETLAMLFEGSGCRVVRASAVRWPPLRTLHQVCALVTWPRMDAVVVAVFSGRSFLMADMATLLASRRRSTKLVLFLHGGNLGAFGSAHQRWVRRVFDRADVLLAPSDFLADVFRSWGYDVRTIPNVIALERYDHVARLEARPALLWMRTFHEHYDPLLAVEVLHRVAQVHPDATLTMGGADQGLLAATRARAAELGVADRIDFAGYLSGDAKAEALAGHDIFLNTNVVDNMPVSVLEAAASGMVPVATAVGGIPALITDGVDGRLVPARDVDAMAAAVLDLIADPAGYAELAKGARALAERSGWPAVQQRWMAELGLWPSGEGVRP